MTYEEARDEAYNKLDTRTDSVVAVCKHQGEGGEWQIWRVTANEQTLLGTFPYSYA